MYLNCRTNYSARYATFTCDELVETARRQGVGSLALTNINLTTDAWEFVSRCRKAGIRPVLGCEIRNDHSFCYVLLAKNEAGFLWINRFLSYHKEKRLAFPVQPEADDNVYVIYAAGSRSPDGLLENELLGVSPAGINKLYYEPVALFPGKYVIRQPVTFQDRRHYHLHRLLRAIDLNTLVSKLAPADLADPSETFIPPGELVTRFSSYPAMIARTVQVLEDCGIETGLYDPAAHKATDKNKQTYTGTPGDDRELLRKLSLENILPRYGNQGKEIMERVEKELRVIDQLGFNAYYLIAWDVVRYARSRDFFYVGRGSGANSIVAYLLRITDVEPIRFDLYFERFLNEFRSSPPDFDLDFSHRDRDEIIDYIFNRYGREHVALLGMQSTFKSRAALRELGKVLGLPKSEIDQLARDRKASFNEDSIQRKIQKYSQLMNGFPNHHSIHAGGILISEKPVHTYTALELPPKGFPTAQIDLFDAERIGLFKLDVLSQRGLGHIKDAVSLVKQNRGVTIDVSKVDRFMNDTEVNSRIKKADTIGCFYIESPAMRQLLTKLECDNYKTLVAASSIIRPGVAQSGMMKQYIHNFRHPESVNYLHPKMKELLSDTLGVMVYQEDVIKVAHHFGGLNMADSDILRRTMSGKYKGNGPLLELEQQFFANCRQFGYPEEVSREVWRQIASFAGFSFSKAHSASFAVESYQSLYLKTYFPIEFMVAVINNFGGFYSTMVYFHELKRAGAQVNAPCVNRSEAYTNLSGTEVFVGLVHVEKLTSQLRHKIVAERAENGPYTGLQDFISRVQPGLEQLNTLIRVGALRFTGYGKKELLWRANFLQQRARDQPVSIALFSEPEPEFELPLFNSYPLEDAFDEIELIGFSLGNAFDLVDDDFSGLVTANEFGALEGREVTVLGQLVCTKDTRTKKGEAMLFGTFLDHSGNWLDTVHWPGSLDNSPFQGEGFYRMRGNVIGEFGVYALEITEMKKAGLKKRYPGHDTTDEAFASFSKGWRRPGQVPEIT